MLQLYHHGSSVCAAKVRLALFEKQVPWSGHYVDILAGEQFEPAYLAINPRGAVPAIVHDGEVITESTVICEYVDESFPGPALKPKTPPGRARMRMWTKLVDEEIHPATRPLTYVVTHRHAILARGGEAVEELIASDPHPGWRERKRRWIREGFAAPDVVEAIGTFARMLEAMETILAARGWLAGDAYSLADGALTPYANRLEMLGMSRLWQDKQNFTRWFGAVKARSSFEPAIFGYFPKDLRQQMVSDGQKARPELEAALARAGM